MLADGIESLAAEPRPSAHDAHVGRRGTPPRGGHALHDDAQQMRGIGAARGRIGGRELATQIAQPNGPQAGVGDGVEHDIAVRVPEEPRRAGHLEATQQQATSRPEGVTIGGVTVAGSVRVTVAIEAEIRVSPSVMVPAITMRRSGTISK